MKFFVAFSVALFASAHAIPAGIVNTGASAVSRSEDGLGNYAFGYNEDHATGGTFRKEKGGPGVQVGSYGLRDADGRIRTVNYVADALGYRVNIETNEPGVDPYQVPAASTLNGNVPVVPAPLIAEPILAKAPLVAAAPVLAAPLLAKAAYGPALAAPLAAAPLVGPAPILAKGYVEPLPLAPIPSAYSVNTQHVSAAPLVAAAPVLAAPLLVKGAYAPALAAPYGKLY